MRKKKCSKREQERRSIPTLDPPTGIRSDCNFDKLRWKLRERRVWRRPRLIGQVSAKRIVDITAHPSLPNYLSFERRQKKKEKKESACRVNSVRTPPFENIAATILRVFIRVGPALDLFALVIRNFTRPSVHTLASFDNPFISTLLVSFRSSPPFFRRCFFFPHAREISR